MNRQYEIFNLDIQILKMGSGIQSNLERERRRERERERVRVQSYCQANLGCS